MRKNSEAIKDDGGKPKFTRIPQKALKEVAIVFTKGEIKYEKFNYSLEKDPLRYIDAALRHINQYLSGQDIDEIETHHLANAASSILMALDIILNETADETRNDTYVRRENEARETIRRKFTS